MIRIAFAATVIAIACIGRESNSNAPVVAPPKVYFGLLDAHVAFSDGMIRRIALVAAQSRTAFARNDLIRSAR